MVNVQNKAAPHLEGWVIAAAAGLVAAAVAHLVGGLDYTSSVFIGALIFLPVGLILGLNWADRGDVPVSDHDHEAASEAAVDHAAATAMPAVALPTAAVHSRPAGLAAARAGAADDLKIIKGVGPALEKLCHSLGFYHFDQVAAWTETEVAWVDENLEGFKGRVTRDRWVPQAKAIVAMGPAEFLRRLDAGEEF
jgi:predicted flap endonuclease-1-like 5' DNA nuclease